ncbi:MAG: hypothetical protein ACYC40_01615 [Patescibacteria group bacterium]
MLSSVSFVKMLRFWNLIVLTVKFILRYWTVPVTGIAISGLLCLFDISLAKIIFWGIFAAFIVAGAHILETKNTEKAEKFCTVTEKTAIALFLLSLAGIIVKYTQLLNGEFWQIFAWPLFATSLILFVLSLFGQLGVSITIYEKAVEEDY